MKRISVLILLLVLKVGAQTPTLIIADSLYAIGNYSEAIENLNKIPEPTEAVQLRLARSYEAKGDLETALDNYRAVLEKQPEKLLTTIAYGEVLIKAGKLQKADSLFQKLTNKFPKNASFQFQLGEIKEKIQDSTYLDYFQKTVLLDSTHQQALYKLSKNALSLRDFATSEKLSLQGLNANSNNASLLSILAQTYFNENSFVLAIAPFEKLLELGQGNEFVHSKLGFCYYNQNNFEDAITQYNMALAYEDRNSDTHYNLGKLYAKQGDLKKSETHLLMALLIKKQPVDSEFLSLALTYKLQEDHQKTYEYCNKALEENPNNERALYERAVAADNYFKDQKTVLNHYQAYLSKYEKDGNENLVYLGRTRMKDIRAELHLKGE